VIRSCHQLKVHPIAVFAIEQIAIEAFFAPLTSDLVFSQIQARIDFRARLADPIGCTGRLKHLAALETFPLAWLVGCQSRASVYKTSTRGKFCLGSHIRIKAVSI